MPRWLFILGKNPQLSLAELLVALESRCPFQLVDVGKEFAVIDATLPDGFCEMLGGSLKMGVVLCEGTPTPEAFTGQFRSLPDRPTIGVSGYGADTEPTVALLKTLLKNEGLKPGFLHKTLTHTEFLKKHVVDRGAEFLVAKGKKFWVARTTWVHNPWEFQKRDTERPVQRSMLSIPPRLCRILIHLSGKKEGVLWDPFCGIGSILQEALLLGFDIRGSDRSGEVVHDCSKNMFWTSRVYRVPFSGSQLRRSDARAPMDPVDAIVTEPYLGPALKRHPGWRQAEAILKDVLPLYEGAIPNFLRSLHKGGRLVIVSPCFRTKKGLLRLPIEQIARRTGGFVVDPLKKYQQVVHDFPLLEYEERHHTGREIVVIEKR